MFAKRLLAAAIPAALALPFSFNAHAGVSLIGIGQISGSDLSGLNGTLENGAPANILGGLGSAIAWAGGDTFLLTPRPRPQCQRLEQQRRQHHQLDPALPDPESGPQHHRLQRRQHHLP